MTIAGLVVTVWAVRKPVDRAPVPPAPDHRDTLRTADNLLAAHDGAWQRRLPAWLHSR